MDRAVTFEHHRARLFGIAYGMLGSVEEAEDVVQEAYLRWHRADVDAVRTPEAWLVAVASRLAIDRLRKAATERAAYDGTWLPEPLPSEDRKSTRLNSSHANISYAVFCLKKKKKIH